jgi:subfamily B ATP-binding cassette protein MsbA
MVLAASSEMAGFSMAMPLIEVIIGDSGQGAGHGIGKYMTMFLGGYSKKESMLIVSAVILVLAILKFLISIILNYLSYRFIWRLSEGWSNDIMQYYTYTNYSNFVKQKQGEILHNLIREPSIAAVALQQMLELLSKIILNFCLYALLIITNWKVTILLTVFSGIGYLSTQKTRNKFGESLGNIRTLLLKKQNAIALENVSSMRLVKTYSLETQRLSLFEQINRDIRNLYVKFYVVNNLPIPISELLLVIFLVITLGCFSIFYSIENLKSMLPFLGLIMLVSKRLLGNVSDIMTRQMNVRFLLPSLTIVYKLIEKQLEERPNEGEKFTGLTDDIIFQHIGLKFGEGRPVFESLSLRIPKGKMTALIGPSGIGKSTIVNLLFRLVKADSGDIIINGRDIAEYSLNSWRQSIGFVSQESVIFNTSIKENIRLGKLDATDEEIFEAGKKAYIHDFVESLPKGYDTEVGDSGVNISGGQRQRIAIARAIIRDPEIYIFDEATSSLDNKTEQLVAESIQEASKGKTVIVIAHRLSTIENADVVYDLGQMQSIFAWFAWQPKDGEKNVDTTTDKETPQKDTPLV